MNEMKNEFLNIASHELRTPMTAIKWYLSMFLDWDYWDFDEDSKDALSTMYNSSQRLINLINDMLDISKLESWKMNFVIEKFETNKLLEWIYSEFKMYAKDKKINFTINTDNNYTINSDINRIKQVIINLLWNAFKFTLEDWTVNINLQKKWHKLLFEIIDSWEWISLEDQWRIFEKFWQVEWSLDRNKNWTWLWLPISREIIEKLWWNLDVKSKKWDWSNFYFTLPIK
jgi:K+-sensing histidine kinase KdpD